jgi:AraC-like DNA-binding protein
MTELHYENSAKTLSVSHRIALSHNMPESHFHSTYEIYYLMSGQREFFIKDRTILAPEGHIVIIAPNILHRTMNARKPKHERFIVNIHESMMTAAYGERPEILRPLLEREYLVFACSPQDRLFIDELVRNILRELEQRPAGFEMYVHTLVLQMLIVCSRHIRDRQLEPMTSPSPMHDRISEIVRYMNRHYMDDLSLQQMAEKFYISPYYLSRLFKEATGFTFVEYLNHVRVKEAKKLLESSSLKVNQISRKVGFGSVTHFGRVFKEISGHPPLYYRKK